MPAAPIPPDEEARQRAIRSYSILNGQRDEWTDELVRAAAKMTNCPIALVTIVDEERQWFKGCIGLDVSGTPREQAFCGYTILGADPLVVEDATKDSRFTDNPLVTGEPGIRFYAGVPIKEENGHALGSLCVIDREPRSISEEQLAGLTSLASLVSRHVASAHRHDAIMGSALDAIITIDEHSTVIEFNEPASRIFGYTPDEAIGRSLAELIIPPALREAHAAGMRHYLETGEGPVLRKRIEITAIRKGGEEFPVELAISPWSVGGKRCFTAFIRDITEAHELNAALRVTRFTMEHARDGVMWVAPDASFLYANAAACEKLGYTAEEIRGMSVFDIEDVLTPNDWPAHWAELRERRSFVIESQHRRCDGTVYPVEISCNYIEHEGQEFNCVFVRDITDRLAAEAALRVSETRFRDIAEAAGEAIWETDAEGRYTYASEQIAELLGVSADEVIGTGLQDRLLPDDANRMTAMLLKAAESDEPFRNIELRYSHATAGVRWLQLSGRSLRDEHGGLAGYRGMSLDVTEFKEAALRRRRLIELQGIIRDVVSMFIDPSRFDDASLRLLAEIGGYFEADHAAVMSLNGRTWVVQKAWRRFSDDIFANGEAEADVHLPDPDALSWDEIVLREVVSGRRKSVHLGIPVFVDGVPDGYIAFEGCRRPPSLFEDKQTLLLGLAESMGHAIERERRRLSMVESAGKLKEALIRANEASAAKSAFLAHVSHELRTPLTAVLGFGRMLREGTMQDARATDLLNKIDSNGQSLLNIINTILDLSKIEAGALAARREQTDTLECIRRAADAASGIAAAKGLAFGAVCGVDVPESFRTDPVRLIQVLTNLLGNAVKYTEYGDVRLLVAAQNDRIRFDIIDTGPGIPGDLQQSIFEPFDRGTARGDGGGTGLGLAIASRLTDLLGGEISLESHPEDGSVFSLTFPLDGASASKVPPGPVELGQAVLATSSRDQNAESMLAGIHVLLAEDSEHVQEVVAYFLRERGARVTICQNGREAVDSLTRDRLNCDLVLMDMQMPILDGYNATREIRAAGVATPIVALTAHGMQHERDQCLAVGCDDYVSKPVEPEFLVSVCRRLVGDASPGASLEADDNAERTREQTGRADMMKQLSERFRLHLIEQADRFSDELRRRPLDLDSIRKHAHKIAGAAGNLGYPQVTDAAHACEHVIRDADDEAKAAESLRALIETIRSSTS